MKNIGEFDNDINELKFQQLSDTIKKMKPKAGNPIKNTIEEPITIHETTPPKQTTKNKTQLKDNTRDKESSKTNTLNKNDETGHNLTLRGGANGRDHQNYHTKTDELNSQPHKAYASLFHNLHCQNIESQNQKQNQDQMEKTVPTNRNINKSTTPDTINIDLTLTDRPQHNSASVKTNSHRKPNHTNSGQQINKQKPNDETREYNNPNNNEENEFRGVYREKKKRLFVDNIHKTSTFYGLLDYLKNTKKLHPSGLKLFKSKRSGHQAAKVHLYPEEAELALTDGFWPRGVSCELWLTREEVIKRGNENKKHVQEAFKGRDSTDDETNSESDSTYRKRQNKHNRKQRYTNKHKPSKQYDENRYDYNKNQYTDYDNEHYRNYNGAEYDDYDDYNDYS